MAGKQIFGGFLKEKRLTKNFGLREFAKILGMKPSNYCSIESDSLSPPSESKLKLIAKILDMDTKEQRKMFDLAAQSKDDIPADLKELIKKDSEIPNLLRIVVDEGVGPKQIRGIVKDIKSGRYRKS
ncbi:MAG TPA: XRE family transcriptional regulator [Nitrospirae bacterium]|nr:helix-turn-helix domain protein [bacterium BMS3Abin10]GBE37967.1 helix-turn-helix domain protein [bacterium BMS3Bbin08]HDK17092.1 XRE family transcriptional regulator [Nitrospirota bacterium]HDO26292.1 XRE family transcriptional regulator [Nitrospirota bacterium]